MNVPEECMCFHVPVCAHGHWRGLGESSRENSKTEGSLRRLVGLIILKLGCCLLSILTTQNGLENGRVGKRGTLETVVYLMPI